MSLPHRDSVAPYVCRSVTALSGRLVVSSLPDSIQPRVTLGLLVIPLACDFTD